MNIFGLNLTWTFYRWSSRQVFLRRIAIYGRNKSFSLDHAVEVYRWRLGEAVNGRNLSSKIRSGWYAYPLTRLVVLKIVQDSFRMVWVAFDSPGSFENMFKTTRRVKGYAYHPERILDDILLPFTASPSRQRYTSTLCFQNYQASQIPRIPSRTNLRRYISTIHGFT